MFSKIKTFILKNVFLVSKKPVLFLDLLEANSLYNENMLIDPSKLNFRFKYTSLYGLFALFTIFVLLFVTLLMHKFFTTLNFHLLIIIVVISTIGMVFCFDVFKIWARKNISLVLIKKAWENHFPFFPYEKYSKKIEEIYNNALKEEIQRRDMQKYVMSKISKS